MGNWTDEDYRDDRGYVRALESQSRYLWRLNAIMSENGCNVATMGERTKWLEEQLETLKLYRNTEDGSITSLVGRFREILAANTRYPTPSPADVLDYALQELLKFEGLKRHLREANIYINFETIFPDDEESKVL